MFFFRNLMSENRRWVTCLFHWKSSFKKPTSGQLVYFTLNPASENRHLAYMFFTSEIQHRKTDLEPMFFFQQKCDIRQRTLYQPVFFIGYMMSENQLAKLFNQKSNVRKPTMGQGVFFIRNRISQNWPLRNMLFLLEIQRLKFNVGQRIFFIWNQ